MYKSSLPLSPNPLSLQQENDSFLPNKHNSAADVRKVDIGKLQGSLRHKKQSTVVSSERKSVKNPQLGKPSPNQRDLSQRLKAIENAFLRGGSFEAWYAESKLACSNLVYSDFSDPTTSVKKAVNEEQILGLMKLVLDRFDDQERVERLASFGCKDLDQLQKADVPSFININKEEIERLAAIEDEIVEVLIVRFCMENNLVDELHRSSLSDGLNAIAKCIDKLEPADIIPGSLAQKEAAMIVAKIILANIDYGDSNGSDLLAILPKFSLEDCMALCACDVAPIISLNTARYTAGRMGALEKSLSSTVSAKMTIAKLSTPSERIEFVCGTLSKMSNASNKSNIGGSDCSPQFHPSAIYGFIMSVLLCIPIKECNRVLKTFSLEELCCFRDVRLPYRLREQQEKALPKLKGLIACHVVKRVLADLSEQIQAATDCERLQSVARDALIELQNLHLVSKKQVEAMEAGNQYGMIKVAFAILPKSKWVEVCSRYSGEMLQSLLMAHAPTIRRVGLAERIEHFDAMLMLYRIRARNALSTLS